MNASEARVVAIDGQSLWVELAPRAHACGSCERSGTCQAGLARAENQPRRLQFPLHPGMHIGDVVTVNVAEGTVWKAAWLSYGVPTMLAIGSAALGQALAGDAGAVAGVLVGLGSWIALMARYQRVACHHSFSVQPAVTPAHLIKDVS